MFKKMVLAGFLLSTSVFVYPGDGSERPSSCARVFRCNVWGAFQCLLARGAQVNPCAYARLAITYGLYRALMALKLININVIGENNRTALMRAARNGDVAMVHALLAEGADVNAADDFGNVALVRAAFEGHAAIVEALIAARAEVNGDDRDGIPLIAAARQCNFATVKALIAARAYVNAFTTHGETALGLSSINGSIATVQLLLNAGAHVNAADYKFRNTSLMNSACRGYVAIVELLLAAKAILHSVNRDSKTALMEAAYYGHSAVAQMIIEEYHKRLPRSCYEIKKIVSGNSQALIERMLPVECGQEVARLLALQEILALRLVSTHCLSYAQLEFEKIRYERAMKLKTRLIRDIESSITLGSWHEATPEVKREVAGLLQSELAKAESLNV